LKIELSYKGFGSLSYENNLASQKFGCCLPSLLCAYVIVARRKVARLPNQCWNFLNWWQLIMIEVVSLFLV
jgi:hypothetical protein